MSAEPGTGFGLRPSHRRTNIAQIYAGDGPANDSERPGGFTGYCLKKAVVAPQARSAVPANRPHPEG
jgi:hypothetical protein